MTASMSLSRAARTTLVTSAAVLCISALSSVASAAYIDESFDGLPENYNSGWTNHGVMTIPGTSLTLLNSANTQMYSASGAGGGTTLRTGGGAPLGSNAHVTIPTTATFSLQAGLMNDAPNPVHPTNQGGGIGIGWSTAAEGSVFNPYGGGGTGVIRQQHVTVGIAKVSEGNFADGSTPPLFRLAVGNGLSQHMTQQFGTDAVALAVGHWYRIDGTIEFLGYDAVADTSTFAFDVSVFDTGADGFADPDAPVLAGTTQLVLNGDFGTQAQAIVYTNADRGFTRIDNISMVPEPASLALLGLGGVLAMSRRRARA